MRKGGYAVIDLKGTATTKTCPGLHALITAAVASKKALLISGLNVSGTIYQDAFGWSDKSSTSHVLHHPSGYKATVTTGDVVTIAADS